eukprot:Gregarina_sp_Poly_1__2773@NODE_176_length_12008_cov_147_545264_g156_i0_p7_GENE_NODE_176_length_12008_cov_147_545264_g156_i0NODE_176_length_12008_cov_147_545264_g156_i0_p7_ORF_typecomplete_len131_score13_24IIGP/PF05049_13/5_7e02IIGP/PF05049_13/1_4e05FtsK_SpoIIIE/PF01580_18/1_1e03FtsK_SpoIIIE/PF01580_18/0_0062MMR_HSR1/PF01926_23/2_3e03MMR_HSR1/PF01926_23/0_011RsgA_GTPase/PF03193_16/0_007AAA_33/PF13671_6/2_1e02AAA_33/PF13671_6/0_1PEPCK_ATP/PF01293_20/0_014TrwB_AAD_bind/PF10412_9/1_1e02TrwB_AAD_bind
MVRRVNGSFGYSDRLRLIAENALENALDYYNNQWGGESELEKRCEEEARNAQSRMIKALNSQSQTIETTKSRIQRLEVKLQRGHVLSSRPTRLDYEKARRDFQYKDGKAHIAVMGLSGTGKSTFINHKCR